MKPNTFFLFILCTILSFFPKLIHAQDFTNPAEYNDYIVDIQGKVLQMNVNYVMESVHNDDFNQVDRSRLRLIGMIENALGKVNAMPAFEENSVFRDEAAAVFSIYLEAFNIEFKEANLLKEKRQESYEAMEMFYSAQDKAEKKLEVASDKLMTAQKQFAEDHNMNILMAKGHSSTQNMIQTINKVNGYTRVVFLAYFKVSKDDAAVLDAMEEKNPGKMESYRKKMLISVDEGLIKLNALGAFEEDDEFRQSAIALLEFHKKMGNESYPELVKFISKKEEDLTQQDINIYNGVIEILNSQPPLLLTKYNQLNMDFYKKHIPGGGSRT